MRKEEWEILRNLDRKTRFLVKEVVELKKESSRVDCLEFAVKDILNDMEEVREMLERRRKIRKVILWMLSIIIAAALTTFVNWKTQAWLQADMHRKVYREEAPYVILG